MIYQDFLDSKELNRYASAMNTRAKMNHCQGILTADLLRDRIFESGGRCEWCALDLVNQDFELDHLISLSRKGQNRADNIVIACPACNRRKSGKHIARFAAEIYRETSVQTPLIQRILENHDMILTTQKDLFDDKNPSVENPDLSTDDDKLSPPPYIW